MKKSCSAQNSTFQPVPEMTLFSYLHCPFFLVILEVVFFSMPPIPWKSAMAKQG